MSDNLIRCVHENGKVCFLTKAATENRNFMKKYGIRVEHVKKGLPKTGITETEEGRTATTEAIEEVTTVETNPEAEAEAVDKQVADALAEATKPAKPKATRTRAAKSKKPTKK